MAVLVVSHARRLQYMYRTSCSAVAKDSSFRVGAECRRHFRDSPTNRKKSGDSATSRCTMMQGFRILVAYIRPVDCQARKIPVCSFAFTRPAECPVRELERYPSASLPSLNPLIVKSENMEDIKRLLSPHCFLYCTSVSFLTSKAVFSIL